LALSLPTLSPPDYQHARLLRYYSFYGFERVKEVGDGGLADLGDQIVWGGVGTRMNADVGRMLAKWTPTLRARRRRMEAEERGA